MIKVQEKPIKVLHLHTRAVIGGSSTEVLLTLDGLPKDRFEGHLACGCEGNFDIFVEQFKSKGLNVYTIKHLFNRINLINDSLAFFEIARLIKKERYDIVHTHNSKAGFLGRLAAKACRVPLIIHTIHSCPFNYTEVSSFTRKCFLLLEKIAALATDHFIAISKHLKGEFVKHRVAKPEKISIIYSGIQKEMFDRAIDRAGKKRELNIKNNDLVVGIVSRMEKDKGHEYIIEAIPSIFERHRDITFLFVGEGSSKDKFRDAANLINTDGNIIFTGLRTDVPEILNIIDIFCLASFYEGMGRVILEAQASGKPVVATAVGGIPEIVDENKTALLIKPKNTQAISQALLHLIEDVNLRNQISDAAKHFVDDRFSADTMVKSIINLYGKLVTSEAKVRI